MDRVVSATDGWRYRWLGDYRLTVKEAQEICMEELEKHTKYLMREISGNIERHGHLVERYSQVRRMTLKNHRFYFIGIYSMKKYTKNPDHNANLCLEKLNQMGSDFKNLWNLLSMIARRDVLAIYNVLRRANMNSYGEQSEYTVRCMFKDLQ